MIIEMTKFLLAVALEKVLFFTYSYIPVILREWTRFVGTKHSLGFLNELQINYKIKVVINTTNGSYCGRFFIPDSYVPEEAQKTQALKLFTF